MSRGTLGAAALLILTIALPADLSAQDPKVAKLMEGAQASFEKGRYQDALEKYQKAHQESGGAEIAAVLGALEASLALGLYDGIITQVSGASSEDPAQQAQIDALVGRAHLLIAYVVDPTASAARREALATEHRKRAIARLTSAAGQSGDWSVRSRYYLAEAKAASGDTGGAKQAVDEYFEGGGDSMTESISANHLQECLESGQWVPQGEPAKVLPSKTKGPAPGRAADGVSVLAAVLTVQGELQCMRMIPPLTPRADEIVYETLARWRYSPAENDAGQAIATPHMVPIDFTRD